MHSAVVSNPYMLSDGVGLGGPRAEPVVMRDVERKHAVFDVLSCTSETAKAFLPSWLKERLDAHPAVTDSCRTETHLIADKVSAWLIDTRGSSLRRLQDGDYARMLNIISQVCVYEHRDNERIHHRMEPAQKHSIRIPIHNLDDMGRLVGKDQAQLKKIKQDQGDKLNQMVDFKLQLDEVNKEISITANTEKQLVVVSQILETRLDNMEKTRSHQYTETVFLPRGKKDFTMMYPDRSSAFQYQTGDEYVEVSYCAVSTRAVIYASSSTAAHALRLRLEKKLEYDRLGLEAQYERLLEGQRRAEARRLADSARRGTGRGGLHPSRGRGRGGF